MKTLQDIGIISYVPLITTTKRYASKIKQYQLPLLYCYAFVFITKEQYLPVLETEHVYKFIRQRKDLLSIPENEINLLKQIVGEFSDVKMVSNSFHKGDAVEIISGNLTGLKGYVIASDINKTVIVELVSIGINLSIEVKKEHLRMLGRELKMH